MNGFRQFNLSDDIFKAIDALGFTTPTKIQEQAIPMLISQKKIDFHGQAQTGTGKTIAFSIPLLQKVDASVRCTQGLIVAPTRELVQQITESFRDLTKFCRNISVVSIYGGVSIENQIRQLKKGAHIVVGTPGRLNDLIRRKKLVIKDLKTLILDEADIMLDMGFKEEIDSILAKASKDREIWLFSATTKSGINAIKKKHMKDPASVRIVRDNSAAQSTEQFYCVLPMRYRFQALRRIMDKESGFYGIVFCQTKALTADVAHMLSKSGYNAAALHGDMDQKMRNKVITKFKRKSFDVLVATDVASRGIDVSDLTHVVNYSFPEDQESYIHRIGRTGRAGKKGVAITFLNGGETRRMKQLTSKFKTEINPIEVPTLEDVMRVKIDKAMQYFNESCDKKQSLNGALDPIRLSMNDMSRDKLVNGAINLLAETFLNICQTEEEIPHFSEKSDFGRSNFERRGRGRRRDNSKRGDNKRFNRDGTSEIVLHIGSDDGVVKSDIMRYFLKSKIDKRKIERVRVIKKRSFVVVCSSIAKKVLSELKDQKIQSRKVRVGIIDS